METKTKNHMSLSSVDNSCIIVFGLCLLQPIFYDFNTSAISGAALEQTIEKVRIHVPSLVARITICLLFFECSL